MEKTNGENRASQSKGRSEGSLHEGKPISVGTLSGFGRELRLESVGASREDSAKRNSSITGEHSTSEITGKIVGQLILEIEGQLAYHEQQAGILRDKLQSLKKISEGKEV
jgi:hypothetical protein